MKEQAKPVVKRFSASYWKSELTRSQERRKKFIETAEESIRVYNAQKDVGLLRDLERRLNVWWYCNNTLLPAYFSSTPKAEVLLRKRSGGVMHQLASVILERNIQYQMDCAFRFDQFGSNSALQLLLTGQAVSWARYVPKFEKIFQEIALFQSPDGTLVDADGNPFDGDTTNAKQGPGSIVLVSVEVEAKTKESAILEIVQYNDYFCSDARTEAEVEWRGRRAFLSRPQAEEMFGRDVAKDLSFDSYPEVIKRDYNEGRDKYEGKAELYEIWSEEAQKVFWVHKNSEKTVVQSSEPPIKFEYFYPCSVITQTQDPDSVVPVSDYAHVKDQVLEIERLTTRIHAVTQTIRTNAVYDSAIGSQIEQLLIGDLKMIPAINWPSYKARGGLANSIEFMPITPYVEALGQLQQARQTALSQLYETLKVSDLLRGTSEQYKSATANRLEAQWSSLGLVVRQNMFAKYIGDSINNLGTIIAAQFDEQKIMEIGDADTLLTPMIPPAPEPPPMDPNTPPEMQPPPPPAPDPAMMIAGMKQEIMQLLRDDLARNYRIQIASDSLVALDYAQDQEEGMKLITTAGEFFNQMRALIEQYPPLVGFSLALFQNMIKRFKGGKELEGIFQMAFNQIGEIAKAKEEAAKQPPPPDPVMQEVQGRLQIAQIEAQARLTAAQMEAQDKATKNQLEYQDQQLQMQRDQLTAQLSIQKQQFEEYIKQQELSIAQQEAQIKANAVQVDMLKVQAAASSDANKQAITQETNRMAQLLEIQKLELEQMRIRMSESEKLMEERRLASEQQLERVRVSMDAITKTAGESTKQQPIVIQNILPKRGKRVGRVMTDELGNPSIELEDRDEDENETENNGD